MKLQATERFWSKKDPKSKKELGEALVPRPIHPVWQRPAVPQGVERPFGDSIFATDEELWSKSRALIRPMFARDRFVDNYPMGSSCNTQNGVEYSVSPVLGKQLTPDTSDFRLFQI